MRKVHNLAPIEGNAIYDGNRENGNLKLTSHSLLKSININHKKFTIFVANLTFQHKKEAEINSE